MKSRLNSRLAPPAIAATLALLLCACATSSGGTSSSNVAVEQSPETVSVEPWDGDGMDIPLDGSSVEAFDRSMARVQAYSSPADYLTLTNAIDYLLVYDLGAKRDKAILVARLDGLTGHQVVEKVSWRRD